VLIMRDILAFSAAETAETLEDTVPAVNSALQRARSTLKKYRPEGPVEMSAKIATDEERRLVKAYMDAQERGDAAAVVGLLADEARLTISPAGLVWDGYDEIAPEVTANMNSLGEFRNVATWANRQPAVAHYLRAWGDDRYRAFTLVVMGIENGDLVDWATFIAPELFESFGLPATL
jgi:RNA polymerase sigma-70 factor, ECF subfamily